MRKLISLAAAGAVATALAGCASSGTPQATAAAGAPTSTVASTSAPSLAPSSSRPSATPTPTPTAHHTTTPSQPKTPTAISASRSQQKPPGSTPTSFGYSPTANAKAQIDAARAAAKADGREVLLDFGASWCGNCVALDESFHTPQVQAELSSAYHLVQIDVGDNVNANMQLLMQYAPSNSGSYGLPVLVVLSSTGSTRVNTDKSGNPGFDQTSFLAFLKKWAA